MEPVLLALIIALVWDELNVHLPNSLHPVAWHGQLVSLGESILFRAHHTRAVQFFRGLALAVTTGIVLPLAVTWAVYQLPDPWLRTGVESVALASTFTITGLIRAARRLGNKLRGADIDAARQQLGSLCSRDAKHASPKQLVAAGIESLAENASDSYEAPLAWYAVLGLPGALVYRACNTLDAMIGYRGRYESFGKFAARLDDLLNLIPARLTAFLFVTVQGTTRSQLAIWWQSRNRTASPNAGYPMAMMAALLGVELEKPGHYRLGVATHPIELSDLDAACTVVRRSAYVTALLALGMTWLR